LALATLAIRSARDPKVDRDHNGIAYLLSAKRNGILTPLMPDYEAEVLRLSDCATLEEALDRLDAPRRPSQQSP